MTLFPSLVTVILGLALCSTGIFICQSATISSIAQNVSEGRSLATGLYYMSYYAGGAAGTLVAGIAYEGWGWTGSVLAIVLVQALAVAIAAVVWKQPTNRGN
jgi:predicted MFS family arabinose efflux permease